MSDNQVVRSEDVYSSIRDAILSAKSVVNRAVNSAMVLTYWEVGCQIYAAVGERAEYGAELLKFLSERLGDEFGPGFSVSNLKAMRQFYLAYPNRRTVSGDLSWSHYQLLLRVANPDARAFYQSECVKTNWSVRQLSRQIHSFYYERMLASQDKDAVAAEIELLEPKPKYTDYIKDPYVLEFLNLKANPHFYESDLEQALIDNLEEFMLELGRGFAFVARQKRISFDGRDFWIDLVFYNYIMRCFVLVDLKTGDLTHQDLGQMSMYVNYYTRELMNEGDNPPVGIVLCADKSDSLVKYTLPEGQSQVFASKYMLCLPSEEELRGVLNEWALYHDAGSKNPRDVSSDEE